MSLLHHHHGHCHLIVVMDNNEPLPPLPSIPRKRGRPKGSRNKRPSRRRRQLDSISADEAFGAAFSSIAPTIDDETVPTRTQQQAHPNPQVDSSHSRVEGDEYQQDQLHLQMLQADKDGDSNDEGGEIDGEEEDVGFGNADMYDVTELLENLNESQNLEVKKEEDGLVSTEEVINKLKHGCVAKNSLRAYTASLILFLIYIYKYDKYLLHRSWIKSIKTFTYGIEDERKKMKAMKKTILVLLKDADENCPPIDFTNYPARHFIKYLLSLRSGTGQRLSTASYNNKRSALFHLFRMYSVK